MSKKTEQVKNIIRILFLIPITIVVLLFILTVVSKIMGKI